MKELFTREDVTPYRRDYTATVPTAKGERLMVELIRCEDCKSPRSTAAIWYKRGYTKTRLASRLPGWRASCKQIGRGFRLSLSSHHKYSTFTCVFVVWVTVFSCCICNGCTKKNPKI